MYLTRQVRQIKPAIDQLDGLKPHAARHTQSVFDARRVVVTARLVVIKIQLVVRIARAYVYAIRVGVDFDVRFVQTLALVGALDGVNAHFVALPTLNVDSAVDVAQGQAPVRRELISL